jgi:hypothetical protein
MASGDENAPADPAPRYISIQPSIMHHLTRKEKELLYEQELIIKTQFEWYWPVLEPLWCPKSRLQGL